MSISGRAAPSKPDEYKAVHAEWYELRSAQDDQTKEIDFWAGEIADAGEPVLELGSGTGRVLVPLLERGLDVTGLDNSADMTARCLAAADARGVRATIHEASMLDFDLGREFGLVFLDSGGLGLFTSDQDIAKVLRRVKKHLRPGGTFIYEFEPVPTKPRTSFERTDNVEGPDGVITLRSNGAYDPATHIWEQTYSFEKSLDGKVVATETNERQGRYFTVEEAVRYASAAGFVDVRATDWLTNHLPRKDSRVISVRCRSQ